MFDLVVLAVAAVIGIAAIGLVVSLFWWLLVLPFKILGWILKALAFVVLTPIALLAALAGAIVFGGGLFLFLLKAWPLVLLVLFCVWLARRGRRRTTATA